MRTKTSNQGTRYTVERLQTTHEGRRAAGRSLSSRSDSAVAARAAGPFGLSRLAWLPVPILLMATFVVWAADPPGSYRSQFLMIGLNFFSTLISAFVAYLVARSFLVRGTPGLLLLGCGVVFWGLAGAVMTVASDDLNTRITIHHTCIWLSALCHSTGVFFTRGSKYRLAPAALWLPAAYTLAVAVVALVTFLALAGRLLPFVIDGHGTPWRRFILVSAAAMFALTVLLLDTTRHRLTYGFTYWYALALSLITVGLLGILLLTSPVGVLSWISRTARFLSGVYMLVAGIASARESHAWGISLETALKGSKDRLRLALGAVRMATWDWDISTDELVWNDEHYRLFGYPPGGVKPSYQAWAARVHPEDLPRAAEQLRGSVAQCTDYVAEYRTLWPDGTVRWVEARGRFDPDPAGQAVRSYGVLIDVTARKHAEEENRRLLAAVQEERDRLSALLSSIRDEIWFIDTEKKLTLVNPAVVQAFGAGIAVGQEVERIAAGCEVYRPDGTPRAVDETPLLRALRGEAVKDQEEIMRVPATGELRHRQVNAAPVRDARGVVIGSVAVVHDITWCMNTQKTLRELNATLESKVAARTAELEAERQRLYDVLEAIPAMVCLLTPDYHVAFANRSFREKFGELNGRCCYEFTFGRTRPCEFCETCQVLQTGRPHRWEIAIGDGKTILDAHVFPFTDVDGSPLILQMDLDITERKRAEAALERMNAMLAHRAEQLQKLTLELTQAEEQERRRIALILHEDLQQQIAGARFYLSRLKSNGSRAAQEKTVRTVDEILGEAIAKSRALSHDLSPLVAHMNELASVLKWLVKQVRAQYGLVVQLEVRDGTEVRSEPLGTFLFRAVQELLFNVAKHAQVDQAAIRVRRIGQCVSVSVSDRGRGFDLAEMKENAGFGLLSIRERVELLGGRMQIKSAPGKGSTFRILVPDKTLS